jgi:DNA topoisomerase I
MFKNEQENKKTYFNDYLFDYLVENQFGGKVGDEPKWKTFEHNGVLFPELYKKHDVPIIYDNEKIILKPKSEEYATLYAKFLDTEYIKSSRFNRNFFKDWKKILIKDGHNNIIDFSKIDFKLINNHILKEKLKTKELSKEEKEKNKEKKEKMEKKYKTALVDGKKQDVGNFRIEPPGLFLGRGCHPLAGKIKRRIYPEDITINISENVKIPELPNFYKDNKWGEIINDNTSEWISSWKDDITGKMKYVWLGAKSDFKAQSDISKFDLARKLKKNIIYIKNKNYENLSSSDKKTKQLATALYFIDNFALRVGNEKSSDEADTVGVCSLRVEHIILLDDDKVKLDFLGKDSIRYQNTIKVDSIVYDNLVKFIKNKKKNEDLFDLVNSLQLNLYIGDIMEGLTAKVFRTYNASELFQKEINNISKTMKLKDNDEKTNKKDKDDNYIKELLNLYNKANIKVALLCNHQKNVAKNFKEQVKKFEEQIKKMKDMKEILLSKKTDKNKRSTNEKIKKINDKIKDVKNKKNFKIEMKNLSLGTSKTNYIDPRITVSFLKKHNIPIEKIFSQTLQDKFFWAMDIDEKWQF